MLVSTSTRVIVIGGGFAGIQAYRSVVRRVPTADVTLIDRNPYATMIPALPDALSGRIDRRALAVSLQQALGSDAQIVTDTVTGIDAERNRVIGIEAEYEYDWLIVTSGSVPDYHGFATDPRVTHTVTSLDGVLALRSAVESRLATDEPLSFVIAGGGYTGLEVAAALQEGIAYTRAARSAAAACPKGAARPAGAAIRIVVAEREDSVLGMLTAKEAKRLLSYLQSIGIEVRTGVTIERADPEAVTLSDGTRVDNALLCWTAGMRAAIAPAGPAARDGRVAVSDQLRLGAYPNIYLAGDVAALQSGERTIRRAVNFAFYSGRMAGHNVAAAIKGRKARRFRPIDLGWVIPLFAASAGRVFGRIRIGGRAGLRLHYVMCGVRHFAPAQAFHFFRVALSLSRRADPLAPATKPPMRPIARWYRSLRPFSFTASIVPVALAGALSAGSSGADWRLFALYAIAALLFHAGANVLNDYYDHAHGVDTADDPGDAHVIAAGLVTPRAMLIGGYLYFALGIGLGAFIAAERGLVYFAVGLTGAIAAMLYTNARVSLKYVGLGDPLVFVLMGPALVAMGLWSAIAAVPLTAVAASVPVALLVTAILHANNVRDMTSDRRSGIMTIAGRIGLRQSKALLAVLLIGAYAGVVVLASVGVVPRSLVVFVTFPVAYGILRRAATLRSGERGGFLVAETAKLHALFGIVYVLSVLSYQWF
ncbi:MAG: hypothetical protein EA382_17450 [Spirochaetaceae bacterium]|nr:MAG: hypothetical protein EA382_17450 [Spirochaetaceae bacterium]